jgi:hypothetical protein
MVKKIEIKNFIWDKLTVSSRLVIKSVSSFRFGISLEHGLNGYNRFKRIFF